jgi:hypothetical protein
MRRHIPGLHSKQQDLDSNLDGSFLVRVERAAYRWHRQKPFLALQFVVLEPKSFESRSLRVSTFRFHNWKEKIASGQLYCTERALWKLTWFLTDFGYDTELLNRDQVDEKAVLNLQGVVRTSHTTMNGRSYQNLDAFAPTREWETLSCASTSSTGSQGDADGL